MHKRFLGSFFILTSFLPADTPVEAADSTVTTEAGDAEWLKLKTAAGQYVKAFNEKKPDAIARLFAENGEIMLQEDVKVSGYDAIQQHYARVFDSNPNSKVALEATSVRFVSPVLAVEEGEIHFIDGEEVVTTHFYTAILGKQENGDWKIVQTRNREVSDSAAHDALSEIEGLVGEWVAQVGVNGRFVIDYRWDSSGAWLIGKGRYIASDIDPITLTMRIGWDPSVENLVSWTFDSEGGFSKSVWDLGEKNVSISAAGVNGDGEKTSSKQRIEVSGNETIRWSFADRIIGEDEEQDFSLRLVKTPPKPLLNKDSE